MLMQSGPYESALSVMTHGSQELTVDSMQSFRRLPLCRLPGFRSGKRWKQIVGSVFYGFCLFGVVAGLARQDATVVIFYVAALVVGATIVSLLWSSATARVAHSAKAGLALGCTGACLGVLAAVFLAVGQFVVEDAFSIGGRSPSPAQVARFDLLGKVSINALALSVLAAAGAVMALKVGRVAAALMLLAAVDFFAAGTVLAIYGASSGWDTAYGLAIWHFIGGVLLLGGSWLAFVARAGSRLAHPSTIKS
jgi:hypothetical protein